MNSKKHTLLTILVMGIMILLGMVVYSVFGEQLTPSPIMPDQWGDQNPGEHPDEKEENNIGMTIPEDSRALLFAVGDNLIHDVIYKQAQERAGGEGYNFDYAYEQIEDLMPEQGLVFVNQETPLATDLYPPSNYPLFNTPTQAGDKLVALGFNLVNQANNHMFDKWSSGLHATMDYWDTQPVTFIGAVKGEEGFTPVVIEQDGMKIGLLGITDHTNGIVPSDDSIDYILSEDRDLIAEQLQALQPLCDFVIVSAHWGDENTFEPSDAQRATAQFLANQGVDLILGHHSHTVQPIERLTGESGEETLVVYSMGNFISAMADWYNMVGGIFQCELVKDGATGRVTIENPRMTPVVTHYESRYQNLRIMPLSQYTTELAQQHGLSRQTNKLTVENLVDTFNEAIDEEFR